jgi:hypothetical protein
MCALRARAKQSYRIESLFGLRWVTILPVSIITKISTGNYPEILKVRLKVLSIVRFGPLKIESNQVAIGIKIKNFSL